MNYLVIHALVQLLVLERALRRDDFPSLMARLRGTRVAECKNIRLSPQEVSHAVDIACALYFHRVLCLHRSAATVLLLRLQGLHAEMFIGVRVLPFKSHAWVEVNGQVVNDKPYVATIYQPIECC